MRFQSSTDAEMYCRGFAQGCYANLPGEDLTQGAAVGMSLMPPGAQLAFLSGYLAAVRHVHVARSGH